MESTSRVDANHLTVVGVAFAGVVATTVEPGPWDLGGILMGAGLGAILLGYGDRPPREWLPITGYAVLLGLCGLQMVGWIGEVVWGPGRLEEDFKLGDAVWDRRGLWSWSAWLTLSIACWLWCWFRYHTAPCRDLDERSDDPSSEPPPDDATAVSSPPVPPVAP